MAAFGVPPGGPRITIRTSLSKTALWGVILLIDLQTAGKDRFYTAEDVERIVKEIIEEDASSMLDSLIQSGFNDMIKNIKTKAEGKLSEIISAGKAKPWTIIQDYEVLKSASEKLKEAYSELEHDLDQRKDLDVFGIGKRKDQVKEAASNLVVKAEKETKAIYAMTSLGSSPGPLTRRSSTASIPKPAIPEDAPAPVEEHTPTPTPAPGPPERISVPPVIRRTSIVSSEDEGDIKDMDAGAGESVVVTAVSKEEALAEQIFIRQVGISAALGLAQTGDFSALDLLFETSSRKVKKSGGAMLLLKKELYPDAIESCKKRVCVALNKKRRSIFGSITKKPTSKAPVIEFCEENEKRTEEIISILASIDNELEELRRTASKDSSKEVVLMMGAMHEENKNLAFSAAKYLAYLKCSTKV